LGINPNPSQIAGGYQQLKEEEKGVADILEKRGQSGCWFQELKSMNQSIN